MSSPSSLRPAWHRGSPSGGRGFQPPPTVADSTRLQRAQSEGGSNINKFAALDDEDDALVEQEAAAASTNNSSSRVSGRRGGRSLADLAASRGPERERSASYGSAGSNGPSGPTSTRYSTGGGSIPASSSNHSSASDIPHVVPQEPRIQFTRERLLSMRPPPQSAPSPAWALALEGNVILSETPQDPVCWDTLDAEAIWATVAAAAAHRRKSSNPPTIPGANEGLLGEDKSRRASTGTTRGRGGGGRWQRGVALPPPDQNKKAGSGPAESAGDLWDDPQATGAAADFSAFGAMPDDDDDEPFDFEKMAEATRKFEQEMHGNRSRASSAAESANDDDETPVAMHGVDPKRPLASIGTTIQSGSMDNVNVFEDFDDPAKEAQPPGSSAATNSSTATSEPTIQAGEQNASSRLMAMIGVTKPEAASTNAVTASAAATTTTSAWGKGQATADAAAVPVNPWGGLLLPGQGAPAAATTPAAAGGGFDMQARMRAEMEQKARDAEAARRKEQEARQAAAAQQQQQIQQQQQQQQQGVQSQVELVLLERISTVLENSWGQSDLVSILSTLHSEDSRVIPLLNNTDALRALILRNPRRIALRSNPVFGTEMAALLLTNAQWQQEQASAQQQQAEAQARSQREEMKRREEQQLQMQQQARIRAIVPGAPWYYSDPQGNIQGPFRGEEMRQWLEAGYFKSDLPISQQQTGHFHPLSALFPDLSEAFVDPAAAAAEKEEQEQAARLEEEQAKAAAEAAAREAAAAREQAEREAAQRKQQAREAAERERRAKEEAERHAQEQAKIAASAAQKDSSQLKMMLGMSADAPAAKEPEKHPSKAKKGQQQQNQQQPPQNEPAPAPAQTKPAWGSAAAKPVAARKSMSEIQNEEARAAAKLAVQQQGQRGSGSSGWANVAASRGGSTGWSGGAAMQRPAAVLQKQPAPIVPSSVQTRVPKPQVAKVATANAQMTAASQQRTQNTSSAEEFGAQMSPTLEKWCKEQMQKLNGTDDLTLVSFCMSLSDPVEIRQYLTTYLGSTAQVNNFATEFIKHKSGAKAQEEWETTATVKKNRKKKAGGR